jgi:NhaP-type Na+/H+ or K+/H+ antiporter
MNRLSCYFEKVSDLGVGLFFLFLGLILTLISFTVVPVIGLVVAIPVLFLAVSFLGAKKSKECALVSKKARKIFTR